MTSRGDERGLFDALRALSATLLGMLQSRLELASLEAAEAKDRFVYTLILALAAALLLGAAVAALSVWFAFAVWDRMGPGVLALLALVYVSFPRRPTRQAPTTPSATMSRYTGQCTT
jgi:uncharacterized membrane protein YqjE